MGSGAKGGLEGLVQVGAQMRSVHELATLCSFNPEFTSSRRRQPVSLSRFCCELPCAFAKALVAWATWQGGGDRLGCRDGGSARESL